MALKELYVVICSQVLQYGATYRLIPFEDVLTILVSIFLLLREGRKGGGRLFIQTESVYYDLVSDFDEFFVMEITDWKFCK